jgi:N-methylhydantoinase A
MGISVEDAAVGIIRIVNANMAKGISGNSVERGYDLREFALVTMGGAAALHAAEIARELNMAKVIVPPMSGNFSAVGLAVADIQHDYVKTLAKREYEIDPTSLVEAFKEMEAAGINQLLGERVREADMEIAWSADLRYDGQSWELNTPVAPTQDLTKADLKKISDDFHRLHQKVYSYSEPNEVIEIVNIRVKVLGKNPTLSLPREKKQPVTLENGWKEMREVYFQDMGWRKIPIYEREKLPAGAKMAGPCIVEEPISTTLIPQDVEGTVDGYRNIIITIGSNGDRSE